MGGKRPEAGTMTPPSRCQVVWWQERQTARQLPGQSQQSGRVRGHQQRGRAREALGGNRPEAGTVPLPSRCKVVRWEWGGWRRMSTTGSCSSRWEKARRLKRLPPTYRRCKASAARPCLHPRCAERECVADLHHNRSHRGRVPCPSASKSASS